MVTDLVISDTLKLLRSMTNHDALYHLLGKILLFKGKKKCSITVLDLPYMSKVSENKLMNGLTDFTHPGGPYFPSRPVRHLASQTMSQLFPNRPARRLRKLVHSCFRLLHPYYWAESLSYHALQYARNLLSWGYLWVRPKTD